MSSIMPGQPGDTNTNAFVVMHGDRPVAVATSLAAAQAEAFARETRYRNEGETRWDEYGPESWRLMRRSPGRPRFAWAAYAVVAVPAIIDGGAR